jgi:hypothetical protein
MKGKILGGRKNRTTGKMKGKKRGRAKSGGRIEGTMLLRMIMQGM